MLELLNVLEMQHLLETVAKWRSRSERKRQIFCNRVSNLEEKNSFTFYQLFSLFPFSYFTFSFPFLKNVYPLYRKFKVEYTKILQGFRFR